MKTIVKLGFSFDELSEDAKEKAIEQNANVNTGYEWWDFDGLTAFSQKEAKLFSLKTSSEYGDLLTYSKMYFDIDRGSYLQFVNPAFRDLAQARKVLGFDKRTWERVKGSYYFDVTGYRNGDTVLRFNDDNGEREWTKNEQAQIDRAIERFADKRDDCLRILRDEYEGQTSAESIAETLRVNDYTFDERGYII